MLNRKLTHDYIRGLIEGEGLFTFSTTTKTNDTRVKIPSFQLKMNIRDKELVEAVRDHLGLKNKVYTYNHPGKDGANRKPYALLVVREIGSLKNVIIPFFYNNLAGSKADQFREWIECIGSDQMVPESYKLIYRLYEAGFYEKTRVL